MSAENSPARSPIAQAAQQDGMVVAQMLIVADLPRSVAFYREVLGGEVLRERAPAMIRLQNAWLLLNLGGGPTPDKPGVTLAAPGEPDRTASFMNIRVADIATVHREWTDRGAEFLTEPAENHGVEIRCYLRDPDGHLIELGQTLPVVVTPG